MVGQHPSRVDAARCGHGVDLAEGGFPTLQGVEQLDQALGQLSVAAAHRLELTAGGRGAPAFANASSSKVWRFCPSRYWRTAWTNTLFMLRSAAFAAASMSVRRPSGSRTTNLSAVRESYWVALNVFLQGEQGPATLLAFAKIEVLLFRHEVAKEWLQISNS